ncbi:hypothetical protein CAPTEDRAFT_192851 [Capitella teleta]|uniref:Uncharacterized protein n=1 Tax=Capitella teleta TaxID=283909 RepID=R7UEG3_CAPTE|nr:hypothetical protein CAPTEDRAFT_192851 [Capitella teleta]|eukprot:ELU01662.1 hypothetical protein CAPTEDRAFT_192851 [Capitella teleta]
MAASIEELYKRFGVLADAKEDAGKNAAKWKTALDNGQNIDTNYFDVLNLDFSVKLKLSCCVTPSPTPQTPPLWDIWQTPQMDHKLLIKPPTRNSVSRFAPPSQNGLMLSAVYPREHTWPHTLLPLHQ